MDYKNYYRKISNLGIRFFNHFMPNKNIIASKEEWEKLAEENHRYYIASRKGRDIDDNNFRLTGQEDYDKLVLGDEFLLKSLEPLNNKNVLEIGCGSGRLLEFFAKDFKEVYGVDISKKMIDLAKDWLHNFNNVFLEATDGLHYPYKNDFFDLVFSYVVFQHMPSKKVIKKNLEEVYKVLKPNGLAKIQLRSGYQPAKWTWYYGPSFSFVQAKKMVEKIGFKLVKSTGEGERIFLLWLKK